MSTLHNAQKYFDQQKQNNEFMECYRAVSEQVDIEWELERVKKHIEADYEKKIVLSELENLQNFIHQATFIPQVQADT